MRLSGILLLALTVFAPVVAAEPPSFVGKRLPYLDIDAWYSAERYNRGALRGHRWILALVHLGKPQLDAILPVLQRTHRPLAKGGPCILLFTKQSKEDIKDALRAMKRGPKLPVAGDKRARTHLQLGVQVFPYFYFMDEKDHVAWQGPAAPGIEKRFADWQGKDPPPEEKPTSSPLPADYREQVDRAVKKNDLPECVRLLRLAHSSSEPPRQPVLAKLWHRLSESLREELKVVDRHLTAERFGSARRRLTKSRPRLRGFPPAVALDQRWSQLAAAEGGRWLERAEKAHALGDADAARRDLQRIVRLYAEAPVAEAARELLSKLPELPKPKKPETSKTPTAAKELTP